MRMSQLFLRTLRDDPSDAEVDSHRLLVRAGFIRKVAAGVYSWLPLGYRVLRKVEQIVREEMDAAGAQELLLPIIQPLELWQRTGRDKAYGPLMFKLNDRKETGFALAPTAEEVITVTASNEYGSYRDLPVNLYQINWKYRDELRPRFGLLRSREFLMKDAYSFDADVEGLKASYKLMYDAYHRVFERCGLSFRPVEAQAGEIGGDVNHEFLGVAPGAMLKCIAFDVDGEMGLALVPGDREVNPFALNRALTGRKVRLWEDADFEAHPDVPKGYIGPHFPGATVRVADPAVGVPSATGWVTGANRVDHHVRHAVLGRHRWRPTRFTS